jgi:cellulose synthase/poly-beta-1,6-N-acetylglucosamine synthase-like glycosyltransferase
MILTQMKIHPWQKKLEISHYKYSSLNSMWTLVMPVYNQDKTINDILKKIHRNAMHNFDMILINDGSNDETLKNSLR